MDLHDDYFDYICGLVGIDETCDCKKLIRYLFDTEFNYTIPMDGNREADGLYLRYRFGVYANIPEAVISRELDSFGCSMLEMMIALSVRANSILTSNDDTSFIFWSMIDSLGLASQIDSRFDAEYCDEVIERFFNHDYETNGKGGLVTLRYPPNDLRFVEIWDQIMWWLDEL